MKIEIGKLRFEGHLYNTSTLRFTFNGQKLALSLKMYRSFANYK